MVRAFIDQVRGVAEARFVHPSWWGPLLALRILAEANETDADGSPRGYRNANGGPDSDTFMAQPTTAPTDAARSVARAVARAGRALEALRRLDGTLEDQPLLCHLVRDRGWVAPCAFPEADRRVAFVLPEHVFLASCEPRVEERLAADLAAVVAGGPAPPAWAEIDVTCREPTPAAVAVGLFPTSLASARHLHRRAWSAGGGPWLGVSDAGELGVVSTCHVAVDGYGHALLTPTVLGARDLERTDDFELLAAAAGSRLASSPMPADPTPGRADAVCADEIYGFAARTLPDVSFRRQAYAFGRSLVRVFRRHQAASVYRRRRFSPVFQVPVVPGHRSDPARFGRRAHHALMSLHMDGGTVESFESFARRIPVLLAAERRGRGAVADLAAAVAQLPIPPAFRRRLLATHRRPHAWLPSQEVLSGRGRLSSLGLDPGHGPARPLYAASAPPLLATSGDPRGSLVLTVIRHAENACSASVFGTGLASTRQGAEDFLDVWLEELEISPRPESPSC